LQVLLIVASVCSFFLAVVHPLGFELALALHIAMAVWAAVHVLGKVRYHPSAITPFTFAIVACAAFVLLKLFDHRFV
jgi:hypothetical protein